ncbi:hypothetical protein [Nocardiopsis quinghaiensis]|uniref:hypothetical protein n=1 Tax=Nocardiopsis quinghaiensis TaxID=464995 RepID=UPI00123BB90B|nr:hypothetical protein [Nocardiopsis quinghaiensis]
MNKFAWQCSIATRDLLILLARDIRDREAGRQPPHRALISEYWEDWVLIDGDETMLVSAKERDLDQGPWEWTDLMERGGVAHLYRNHRRLPGASFWRLSTNNALLRAKTGSLGDLCLVSDVASGSPRSPVTTQQYTTVVHKFAQHLLISGERAGLTGEEAQGRGARAQDCVPTGALLSSVSPFLDKLRLDTNIPGRRDIDFSAPLSSVKPILKALKYPEELSEPVWWALRGFVEQSMTASVPLEWGELSELVHLSNSRQRDGLPYDLLRRRITTEQAREQIDQAVTHPRRFLVPHRPHRHTVSVKMDAGGCGANAIQRAKEDMKEWQDTVSAEVDDSPGNHAQMEVFAKELRQHVDDVEYDLFNQGISGKDFGRRLWGDSIRLPVDGFPSLPFPLTRSLLTGAIADASDHCRIWFTEEMFDASGELQRSGEASISALAPPTARGEEE